MGWDLMRDPQGYSGTYRSTYPRTLSSRYYGKYVPTSVPRYQSGAVEQARFCSSTTTCQPRSSSTCSAGWAA